jgi:hypothetical protein
VFRQPCKQITQSAHSRHPGISSLPISVQHHDINKQEEGKINRRYTIFYSRLLSSTLRLRHPFTANPDSPHHRCILVLSIAYLIFADGSGASLKILRRSPMIHRGFPPSPFDKLSPSLGSGFHLCRRLCVFTRGAPHSVSISYYVSLSILVKVTIYYDDFPLFSSILFSFHRQRIV